MKIPKRIAQALINSLKGGVVPRVGLPYVTVGRKDEIDALLRDVDIIADGGASFRFIVGKYGSGKSFLLQTIRNYVMAKNFVVVDADLSPERRLQGTRGQGLATYKELIRNMSTKTKPEGGALPLILDRWISSVQQETMASSGLGVTDPGLAPLVEKRISAVIGALNEMVHGFDFARLLTLYYKAHCAGDDETKAKVLKWFRGEYATKTEARQELGVNIVITDDDWYEYLKLFAFLRMIASIHKGAVELIHFTHDVHMESGYRVLVPHASMTSLLCQKQICKFTHGFLYRGFCLAFAGIYVPYSCIIMHSFFLSWITSINITLHKVNAP